MDSFESSRSASLDEADKFSIAIVGMAGRFPGARNIDQFWQNLHDGVESIRPLSDAELRELGATDLDDPRLVKAAAILDDLENFDASFFGYTPTEALVIDPQQRVFLETAWEALEHAGYEPTHYPGSVGVYGGSTISTYMLLNLVNNPQVAGQFDPVLQLHVGNAGDFLTTRVSYKLNLKGPSHQVGSACSTSLVALHLACQSLINQECDMALAGGVSINLRQRTGYLYEEGSIGSPDGHCRVFDEKAQGTIFGCGVGVVVIKRLEDAVRDGDTIQAVIKGWAVNNDGSHKVGFTAPSVEGQFQVITEALDVANVKPETISYIEAHGTGTALGDPIEIQALSKAFQASTDRRQFCGIGSVKTNLGHLEAAAGVVGLIKTVLALKHHQIPASLHFEKPNPAIDFASSPFYVVDRLLDWPEGDTPRRAGVSSFGFGGTNAHIILEEAPAPKKSSPPRPAYALPLSARTASALETATANLRSHLEQHPDQNLGDVAYTLQVGRQSFGQRRLLVCRDRQDALAQLQEPGQLATTNLTSLERPVAFMFPGQGTQYTGMARSLYQRVAFYRQQVDECCRLLRPHLGFDLTPLLVGPAATDETDRLNQTALAQPALFVVEYALAKLWQKWGVQPQAMIGHSIGEYVAATLAGVFSLNDALGLVAARGRLMQEMPSGKMLAVSLAEADLLPLLALAEGQGLDLAAVNGPELSVVAGPSEKVARFEQMLTEREIASGYLHTSHAFHSAMMQPAAERFAELVAKIARHAPRLPFMSNLTGQWITNEQATDPGYWAAHLRQTVRFGDGLAWLGQNAGQVLLEIGPGQTLGKLARRHPAIGAAQAVLATLPGPQDTSDPDIFHWTMLGKVWLHGVALDWAKVYDGGQERPGRVPLPTYPFERQRYWIAPASQPAQNLPAPTRTINGVADWFYAQTWQSQPLTTPEPDQTRPAQTWLVFAPQADHALSQHLSRMLSEAGQTVIQVRPGQEFGLIASGHYSLDATRPAHYRQLLEALDSLPAQVVLVGDDTTDQTVSRLLNLTKAITERSETSPVQLTLLGSGLADVSGTETLEPSKAAWLGLTRVLNQEYPALNCRVLDIPTEQLAPARRPRTLAWLQSVLFAAPDPAASVLAYRGSRQWVATYQPLSVSGNGQAWPEQGRYLVVNGLQSVGLAMAQALSQAADHPHLIVTTRQALPDRAEWDQPGLPEEIKRQIAGVRSLEQAGTGVQVEVRQADPACPEQLEAVLAEAEQQFGPLNGVLYALDLATEAGELELLGSMATSDPTQFLTHWQTARQHLQAIEQALSGQDKLDFCILGSSLASVLGGPGYGLYAGLYSLLDAYVQEHNRIQTQNWLSLNWNIWQQEDLQSLTNSGATLPATVIMPIQGAQVLNQLLGQIVSGPVVVSTADLNLQLGEARHPNVTTGLTIAEGSSMPLGTRANLATAFVAPRNDYEAMIADIWQQVLGIAPIGVEDNFFDLGGHSLLVTQLLNKLHKVYPVALSMRNLFENSTVAAMARLVEEAQHTTILQNDVPIREQLKTAFPTDRPRLLETYWRGKLAQALKLSETDLPDAGDLTHFDLEALAPEIIWHFQQDFKLKIYLHEIPAYPSVRALAEFTQTELDRLAALKAVETTAPNSLYERAEAGAASRPRMTPARLNPTVKNPPIIFLHGSPRSGSTIFRVMLAGHPALFAPPEMDILWYDTLADWQLSMTDPNYGHGFGWASQGLQWVFVQLLGQPPEVVKARLDKWAAQNKPIHEVYAQVQNLIGKRRLVDKTPTYSMSMETLRRSEELFDKPKHIFLIRHPYAMIESFLRIRLDKLFGPNIYGDHAAEVDPYVIGEKVWNTCNQNLSDFLSPLDPARQFVIRYEDLVADPRRHMTELCDFLEIAFDEAVLQPYDDKRERMITGIGDPNILQHDKIDPELGDAWRKIKLPHRLGEQARRLADRFGYELPAELQAVASTRPDMMKLSNGLEVDLSDEASLNLLLDRLSELTEDEVSVLLERINV